MNRVMVALKNSLRFLPDKAYLQLYYLIKFKKLCNFQNPHTYNEKLQWLKLHDRKPEYTMMVDKYRVREYIAQKIGEEYLIPLLGIWDDLEDIDFSALPTQFVLKCNHNSQIGLVVCKDKESLDIPKVKAQLRDGLKQDYYWISREWPYKDVPRKIVCEKYMEDAENPGSPLVDYKFFCFEGEPVLLFITRELADEPYADVYDMEYHRQDISMGDPPSKDGFPKPKHFEEMKRLAATLASGHHHIRVDFYEINDHVYFGELTLFHCGGFSKIHPNWVNRYLGDLIILDKERISV